VAGDLVLALGTREGQIREAFSQCPHRPPILISDDFGSSLRPAARPALQSDTRNAGFSILYTSGTTGRPKGCVLSHYEIASGVRYASLGGLATLFPRQDRIYNPLPLYHVNSGVFSLFGVILTGNRQIQPERFHPQRWWREIVETRATIVHYLGIIAAMMYGQPPADDEGSHQVRFGLGAGIEPQLHQAIEQRFGFPFIEIWGMTEMVRVLADSFEPRQVGTRAFGRPILGVEIRVVDGFTCIDALFYFLYCASKMHHGLGDFRSFNNSKFTPTEAGPASMKVGCVASRCSRTMPA
jgi:acyl-CoA synthetase (AMP-forming)/AMP-acid ligase II